MRIDVGRVPDQWRAIEEISALLLQICVCRVGLDFHRCAGRHKDVIPLIRRLERVTRPRCCPSGTVDWRSRPDNQIALAASRLIQNNLRAANFIVIPHRPCWLPLAVAVIAHRKRRRGIGNHLRDPAIRRFYDEVYPLAGPPVLSRIGKRVIGRAGCASERAAFIEAVNRVVSESALGK